MAQKKDLNASQEMLAQKSADFDQARRARVAQKICELGGGDADLAIAFDVSEDTIAHWRSNDSLFAAAWKVGIAQSATRIAYQVYQSALGRITKHVHLVTSDRAPALITREHIETPDLNAAKFLLTNRRPNEWKNRPTADQSDFETQEAWRQSVLERLRASVPPTDRDPKHLSFGEEALSVLRGELPARRK
jgi:hypothetical protein